MTDHLIDLSTGEIIAPLTEAEQSRLAQLEEQIDTGLNALWEIREQRLWREYPTFEAYVSQRWGDTSVRRKNQRLAGLRVFGLLRDALGSDVPALTPLPQTEFSVRPIAGLSTVDPQKAIEVYVKAVELAHGTEPSNAQVMQARSLVLNPKEQRMEDARWQIEASPYHHLKRDLKAGSDPMKLLALSDALTASELEVRRQMIMFDIHDTTLIRMINAQYQQGNSNVMDLFRSRTLQFTDGTAIGLENATAKDYQKLLSEHYREHLATLRSQNKGKAVSVVVFNEDAFGTLESLKQVLSYTTLLALQNLIGAM